MVNCAVCNLHITTEFCIAHYCSVLQCTSQQCCRTFLTSHPVVVEKIKRDDIVKVLQTLQTLQSLEAAYTAAHCVTSTICLASAK